MCALYSFEKFIQGVQKIIVTDFHKRQNRFEMALIDCLSDGTKSVPHDQLSEYDYYTIVNQDIRNVVADVFVRLLDFGQCTIIFLVFISFLLK